MYRSNYYVPSTHNSAWHMRSVPQVPGVCSSPTSSHFYRLLTHCPLCSSFSQKKKNSLPGANVPFLLPSENPFLKTQISLYGVLCILDNAPLPSDISLCRKTVTMNMHSQYVLHKRALCNKRYGAVLPSLANPLTRSGTQQSPLTKNPMLILHRHCHEKIVIFAVDT